MQVPNRYLPYGSPGACWQRSQRRLRATTPRQHHEIVVLHTLTGSMRYMIDDKILTVGPRTLLWAFSDQSHMLLSETADFDMWVFVLARETLLPPPLCPPPLAEDAAPKTGAFLVKPAVHEELIQIAKGIRASSDDLKRSVGLRWWVMQAWDSCGRSNAADGYRSHPAVQRAVECLQDTPDLSLAAIADQAGLSQSHLNRLFRREVGQPLGAYRTHCRLLAVDRGMTEASQPNLLRAAHDAGFGSYSQFYRCFLDLRGVNPRTYYTSQANSQLSEGV